MEINQRIRMIIESHRLTAGAFADKIGVQRSNVSHVLSGRNKPSFEFLEKVVVAFPRVSALWLLTGKQGNDVVSETIKEKQEKPVKSNDQSVSSDKKLVKTILIYSDNSCEEYTVSQQ